MPTIEPIFFASPAHMRAWFEEHHATATELIAGFHKKATGRPTLTWSEAVDEALCFGWIDGVRRSYDADSYTNRFTPRKPTSNWSAINVAKVEALTAQGLMRPEGIAAFARRPDKQSRGYSFKQTAEAQQLPAAYARKLRAHKDAAAYFASQPPGYRRMATFWVVSAKQEATRLRRLDVLIANSAEGQRLPHLRRSEPKR